MKWISADLKAVVPTKSKNHTGSRPEDRVEVGLCKLPDRPYNDMNEYINI